MKSDFEFSNGCGSGRHRFMSSKLYLAIFIATPIIVSLITPTLKDSVKHLFTSVFGTPAYEGDGILTGDSGTYIPFSSINWTITQKPMFRDSFHMVSIFAIPEVVARRHLFLYRSNYSTYNNTFQVRKDDIHSVGARVYVYLLSETYLNDGQVASATINVRVLADFKTETLSSPTFRFKNREAYSNFVDLEPGAMSFADGCNCMLGENVDRNCDPGDDDCKEQVRAESQCPPLKFCSSDGVHTSKKSSYNFISSQVAVNDTVGYDIDLQMYFYNTQAFDKKYYICTIRGTDYCSFQTPGEFIWSRSWKERHIIIAYTHPSVVPSSPTTYLVIESEIIFDYPIVLFLVCLLIIYLIIRHCFHLSCLRRLCQ